MTAGQLATKESPNGIVSWLPRPLARSSLLLSTTHKPNDIFSDGRRKDRSGALKGLHVRLCAYVPGTGI